MEQIYPAQWAAIYLDDGSLETTTCYRRDSQLASVFRPAGRTFRLANAALGELGASAVRTARLAIHSKSLRPNYFVFETDALIVWPWDRDILSAGGTWSVNPEYAAEMHKVAGYVPGPSPALEREGKWLR